MTKKEYALLIREQVMNIWQKDELAESTRSSFIWLYRLVEEYTEEEILAGAKWLRNWAMPYNISQLYFAMPSWKREKAEKEKKEAWKFT